MQPTHVIIQVKSKGATLNEIEITPKEFEMLKSALLGFANETTDLIHKISELRYSDLYTKACEQLSQINDLYDKLES